MKITKNFRIRTLVCIILLILACIFLAILDGILFKYFYIFVCAIALIELLSFFSQKKQPAHLWPFAIFMFILLVCSSVLIYSLNVKNIIIFIVSVCSYDVFAYVFGMLIGAKIIKSHPFPKTSPGKTWEGTILGLVFSLIATFIAISVLESSAYIFMLSGVLALIGDLLESKLKRLCKVKDSNELIIKYPFYGFIEMLLGGSEGHGGYLDRVDSMAFSGTIYLIIQIALVIFA